MIELSEATRLRVHKLFPPATWSEVEQLLAGECSNNLPLYEKVTDPSRFERIQFAVLKLSEGDPGKLRHVIDLAKRDWRDVLMGAGFGDLEAHREWMPD